MRCQAGAGFVSCAGLEAPTAELVFFGLGFEFLEVAFEVGFFAAVREVGAFGVDAGKSFAGKGFGEFLASIVKEDEGVESTAFKDGLPAGDHTEGATFEEALGVSFGFETDGDGLVA